MTILMGLSRGKSGTKSRGNELRSKYPPKSHILKTKLLHLSTKGEEIYAFRSNFLSNYHFFTQNSISSTQNRNLACRIEDLKTGEWH